jgi:hypothetical protein
MPGLSDERTVVLSVTALMSDDLPTLLRPQNATCKCVRKWEGERMEKEGGREHGKEGVYTHTHTHTHTHTYTHTHTHTHTHTRQERGERREERGVRGGSDGVRETRLEERENKKLGVCF